MKFLIRISLFITGLFFGLQSYSQEPLGQWTFEPGEELEDKTGNFEDLKLVNTHIEDGYLYLDSNSYAYAMDYSGPNIGANRTMVVWLMLDNLDAISGIVMCTEAYGYGRFDAILYHAIHARKWVSGSEMWIRSTTDDISKEEETKTGELIQLALVHELIDQNTIQVSIYRNGDLWSQHKAPPSPPYYTGSTHVKFGMVGNTVDKGYYWIKCRIEEARIYDRALSPEELQSFEVVNRKSGSFWWVIGGSVLAFLILLPLVIGLRKRRQ